MVNLPEISKASPDGSPIWSELLPPFNWMLMLLTEAALKGPAPPLISVAPPSVLDTWTPEAVC